MKFPRMAVAKGRLQVPTYTPYIVADVTAVPWPVGTAEHTAALASWKAGKEKKKTSRPQSLPLNAWVLYRMRFIFTAEVKKWKGFLSSGTVRFRS